jgi:hypothetical protein
MQSAGYHTMYDFGREGFPFRGMKRMIIQAQYDYFN